MHCSTIYSLIHALERQRVQEDICICICGYSTCSKHLLLPVECSVAVLAGQFNVLYMALAHARGPPRKYTVTVTRAVMSTVSTCVAVKDCTGRRARGASHSTTSPSAARDPNHGSTDCTDPALDRKIPRQPEAGL